LALLKQQRRGPEIGLVQLVVDYLISLGSLLYFDNLDVVVRLIIMMKLCHYGCSQVLNFYGIDESGLWLNYFLLRSLRLLEKIHRRAMGVLQATTFTSSSASVFLFLSMYSTVKPLK
jgi:hypothetical protein